MSYLGEDIKKLGFGLMRLPQKDGNIDIEQITGCKRQPNVSNVEEDD